MTEQLLLSRSSRFLCVCLQTLQDRVCEFQARLRSEEVTRHLLLQQLQQHSVQKEARGGGVVTLQKEQTSAPAKGESRAGRGSQL